MHPIYIYIYFTNHETKVKSIIKCSDDANTVNGNAIKKSGHIS